MKKVKTIIASLVVIFASIFVSACSCGESSVPQVYVTDINIRCVTPDSDGVWSTRDEASGIVEVYARVGEIFGIEYTLTPVDATFTQVNWEFSNKNLVKTRSGESTRKKSTTEVVEFVAKERSNSKFTTELTFTANITGSGKNGTEKSITCKITVLEKKEDQDTLPAPANIHFNSNQNRIEWDKVSSLIKSDGNINYNPTLTASGTVSGLSGYKVSIKDKNGNLVEEKDVRYTDTYCDMPSTGEQYTVSVRALGSETVNSGEYSTPYTFYKLSDATELANNNGTVTFVAPQNAYKHTIYYYGVKNDRFKWENNLTNQDNSGANRFYTRDFQNDTTSIDKYDIALVFYPNYYDESLGYAEVNGVKYFPSTPETSLDIQKLSAPSVQLSASTTSLTVGGVAFEGVYGYSRLEWELPKTYDPKYDVKFDYTIKKVDSDKVEKEGVFASNGLDLNSLTEVGNYVITIKAVGNTSNTISSAETIFNFDITDDSDFAYTLEKDCLKDTSENRAGGLELFFVYQGSEASTKSRRVVVDRQTAVDYYDISSLGLDSGSYKLYARHIYCTSEDFGNVGIIAGSKDKLDTPIENLIVSPVLNDLKVTKTGEVTFAKPTDSKVSQYRITVTQLGTPSVSFDVVAVAEGADENQVQYTIEGNNIVVNLFDVVTKMLESSGISESVDLWMQKYIYGVGKDKNNFSCTARSEGYSDTDAVIISSSDATAVKFSGSTPVGDITLNDYKLSFTDVGSDGYKVELIIKEYGSEKVYEKYQFEHQGNWTAVNNAITTDLTKDELYNGQTLAELIEIDKYNFLSVISVGTNGSGTTSAVLNSLTNAKSIGIANTPSNLAMGQDGYVSWKTTSTGSNYTYDIYFELVTENDDQVGYSPLSEDTLRRVTADTVETSGGETTLKYDIGDILAKYPDQVIAVRVRENKYDMFSGALSERFYATRITPPVLAYSESDGAKKITWEEIDNAKYYEVTVTKDGDTGFTFAPRKGGDTSFSITSMIDIENGWEEGVYNISVVAGTDLSGESSVKTPCVITSIPSTKVVRIVSGSLDVAVNDQDISWNNICVGTDTKANYSVAYNTGNADITEGFVYSVDKTTLSLAIGDKLTAGNNTIVVTPTINYAETGFIIIGEPKTNNITKWAKASALQALGGTLQFQVTGASSDEDIVVELYSAGESDTLVASSSYTITSDVKEGYIQYSLALDGLDAGSLSLKVRIKSEGKISSELSDVITKNKLSTATDLSKEGEWLVWTASEQGIDYYIISYKAKGAESYESIRINLEYNNTDKYKPLVENSEGFYVDADTCKYDKDNSKFYYKFDESIFVGDKTGDIDITIRAFAGEGYYNGNTSSPYTITKLNSDTEVTADGGILVFEKYTADGSATPNQYKLTIYYLKNTAGEGEEPKYEIDEDQKYETGVLPYGEAGIDSIDLNDISIGLVNYGRYKVVLQYIGNGNEVLDSAEYEAEIEKLDIGVLATSLGQISWSNTVGATLYTLEISNGGDTQYVDISSSSTENTTVITEDQLITADGLFRLVSGKDYTLRLMASAEGKLHSKWSEPFTIKKLKTPTTVVITTSEKDIDENVKSGTPIITWVDPNNNNSKYTYQLKYDGSAEGNDEEKTLVNIGATTIKQYTIERGLKKGSYNVLLRVMGNTTTSVGEKGLLSSDFYDENTTLIYVSNVDNPTISNGVISWNAIEGAYSYGVTAKDADGNIKFTRYTVNNSIDFSDFAMGDANNSSDSGVFTFEINALTDPRLSIVSTVEETVNSASLFKPNTLQNFRVKDGMLNWRIATADIATLISANNEKLTEAFGQTDHSDILKATIKYVIGVISNDKSLTRIDAVDEIITHLLKVRLNINSVEMEVTPVEVILVDSNGDPVTSEGNISAPSNYLEYSYEVSIEPTITSDSAEEGGEDAGNEEDVATQSDVETGMTYNAGRYDIRISAVGNSSTDVPIVNGGYTSVLTAYKPDAPITWMTNDSDIALGKVQWGLSTTPKSTSTTFDYHQDYKVTAILVNNDNTYSYQAYQDISVSDTLENGNNPNLSNKYQYYRNLKDDLFTTDKNSRGTNILEYNTEYRLLINVRGTADSSTLNAGEFIYLNSNKSVVGAHANILNVTANTTVTNSELQWKFSNGSTMTRVYVYGPFNNLNGNDQSDSTSRNTSWVDSQTSPATLANIKNAYLYLNHGEYDESLLPMANGKIDGSKVQELASQLHVLDFRDEEGKRVNKYTLTDAVYNSDTFGAGGYLLYFQEIGDQKGVIDSVISENALVVEKLASPVAQTTTGTASGWVGTGSSNIYVWQSESDTYTTTDKYAQGAPMAQIGSFVWNRVIGANAYKIELYRLSSDGTTERVEQAITQETIYEPKTDAKYTRGDKYFITIVSVRVKDITSQEIVDNFFNSDLVSSTEHERVTSPSNIGVYDDGKIEWEAIKDTSIAGYRIQFGYKSDTEIIATTATESNIEKTEFDLSSAAGDPGTIAIAIRTIATSGSNVLSSWYGSDIRVTCLADPYVRVADGVFNWGWVSSDNIVDPLTDSKLKIDNNDAIIIKQETKETSYIYYTEIDKHKSKYTSEDDEKKFTRGEHTFTVKFLGSGGETSQPLGDGSYIASSEKTLTATKLSAPAIENVQLDLNSDSENLVKWGAVSNALGYKVRVFYRNDLGEDSQAKDYTISLEDLNKIDENHTEFMVTKSDGTIDNVYFKLSAATSFFNLSDNGGTLFVYVQALGSTAIPSADSEDKLYLSSSYSTPTTIGIPPAPSDIKFNGTTGVVEWKMLNQNGEDIEEAYGIKLQTSYEVKSVTSEELSNYWFKTSNSYAKTTDKEATINESPETPEALQGKLYNRAITYSGNADSYTVYVVDIIYLSEVGQTPTSYKVTTIADNYKFSITAITFKGDDAESSNTQQFKSETQILDSKNSFNAFGKGDGSEGYVYTISTYDQLNRVRNFTDRHFAITSDISFEENSGNVHEWQTIENEFTGSIDGNNNTLSNIKTIKPYAVNGDTRYALFAVNKGTISNLNIDITLSVSQNENAMKVAGLAIENTGTIDNVTVTGSISAINTSSSVLTAEYVGGIVSYNRSTGIISNSTVNATIYALDNSSTVSYAGGIAGQNEGTITCSKFTSTITSNYVGGIAGSSSGIIDRCITSSSAQIKGVAKNYSGTQKSATIGGVVGGVNGGTIQYSYSQATISVAILNDSTQTVNVGGLVGNVYDGSTIKGNYVVSKITTTDGSSSNKLFKYDMLLNASNTTMEKNYYIVGSVTGNTINSAQSNGGTLCNDIDALNNAVASITDAEGKTVYATTTNEYPTLAWENLSKVDTEGNE